MNIHPLIVHFPIALLTCYVLVEILPLERWYPQIHWYSVRAFLVVVGTLGALAGLASGSLAEEGVGRSLRKIVGLHETFADLTTIIFGVLAVAHLVRWVLREHFPLLQETSNVTRVLRLSSDFVLKRWIAVPLAILGAIAITVTGALGGMIVYGPDVDVVTKFLNSVFFN